MSQTTARRRQAPPNALVLTLTFGLFVLCSGPGTAAAQGEEQLESALKRAMESYDSLAMSEAEKELEDAVALADRLGLGESTALANLHLFRGVVLHALGDESGTRAAFRQGLQVDRDAVLFPDYATPDITAIFNDERSKLPDIQDPSPDPSPDIVDPNEGHKMNHTPPSRANDGAPLNFMAEVSPTVPLYRIVIYHRRFGEAVFKDAEMKPESDTAFTFELKGSQVCSSQIDYYIEVLDRTGNILISEGDRMSPRSVPVLGASGKCGETEDDNNGHEEPSGDRQYVFIQVGPGLGAGLVTPDSSPLVNPDANVDSGLSLAPFHITSELGFLLTESLHLSATFRSQLVFLTDGVELEPSFGAKLRWYFDNEGDFIMYTGVGGGFGFVRHLINVQLNEAEGPRTFTDTIQHGPAQVGFAFGFGYKVNDNFALVTDFYLLGLIPQTSVNLDVNLSMRVSF